nr:MAG TPA: hypothetical protein [Caudoviricetes sp.]
MNLNYESGKVGDYKGTPVYTIEEIKFEPKRANRNFIYALGHQGTSENLNLIFWDGSVWRQLGTVNAAGSDVKENRPDSRPVYSFGKTEVEKEEDWLVEMKKATKARIKEEKKSKPAVSSPELTKVEEIEDLTTLSAGIDDYIQSQLNRDWLGQS